MNVHVPQAVGTWMGLEGQSGKVWSVSPLPPFFLKKSGMEEN